MSEILKFDVSRDFPDELLPGMEQESTDIDQLESSSSSDDEFIAKSLIPDDESNVVLKSRRTLLSEETPAIVSDDQLKFLENYKREKDAGKWSHQGNDC